jgi:hypothetical protein
MPLSELAKSPLKVLGLPSGPAIACDFNSRGPQYPAILAISIAYALGMLYLCILGSIHSDVVVI